MRKLFLSTVLVSLLLGVALVVVAADAKAPVTAPAPSAAGASAKPAPKAGPATAEEMSGVDFSGLTDAQKKFTVDLLNESNCDCSCGMKIAVCRRDDSKCPRSLPLSQQVVSLVKQGKTREEIVKAVLTPPSKFVAFDLHDGDAPSIGPKTAKVTIIHYYDYQCPYCSKIVPTLDQLRADYPNDVRIVYKMHPLSIHQNAMIAAQAAVAAQNQGKFPEMNKKLFEAQRELSRDKVIALAKEIGLDADRFVKDIDSPATKARIDKEAAESEGLGATGTPASFVNGRYLSGAKPVNMFKEVIDEELKWARDGNRPKFAMGKNVSEASAKPAANAGPDPAKKYDIPTTGAPTIGPATAKVTIVHAYDYQCPYCVRIHPTMEQLLKDYPTDVRIVYMQHPLPMHQQAGISAEAVMAAKAQGKFREMHEKLMAANGQLSREKIMAAAQEIGLDMKKFTNDIDNDTHKPQISAMTNEVMKVGATGTPASFINGRYLNGAQPIEAFKKLIDEELGKATVAGGTK